MMDETTGSDSSGPLVRLPTTEIGDFAGLGKAVSQFLQHVANATGVIYRPKAIRDQGKAKAKAKQFETDAKAYEIVRMATARAEAAEIRDDALFALQEKAVARLRTKAIRQQINIDTIVNQTASLLVEESSTSFDTSDWLVKFIDYAQDVSDPKLQAVWSELLARKMVSDRRSVSLMTLDAIRLIEPRQALLFDEITRSIATFGFYYWTFPNVDSAATSASVDGAQIAKSYDDLDVLAELRLVHIEDHEPPEEGKAAVTFTNRFCLKIQRGNRKLGHTHYKEIKRSIRGEELTRVVLKTTKEEDLIQIYDLNKDKSRAYKYLTVEQQADSLKRMFNYLKDCNYDCLVGGASDKLFPDITHQWNGSVLIPLNGSSSESALPPELACLL